MSNTNCPAAVGAASQGPNIQPGRIRTTDRSRVSEERVDGMFGQYLAAEVVILCLRWVEEVGFVAWATV
jgi:hypothetical protein